MSKGQKEYIIKVPDTITYYNNPMRNLDNKINQNSINFNKLKLSGIEKQVMRNRNFTLRNRKSMILNRRRRLNTRKNKKRIRSLMTYKTTKI